MSKTKPLAGKTITLPVYVRAERVQKYGAIYKEVDGFDIRVSPSGLEREGEFILCKTEATFTVPAYFDPVPPMVARLQEQKAKLTAEFAAAVAALNKQLFELQAIECDNAEVPEGAA